MSYVKTNQKIDSITTKYRNIISIEQKYLNDTNKPRSLMNNFILLIPAYQRPYSWTKKNINQLLSDLLHQVKFFDNADYFLGMIFTIEKQTSLDSKVYEIIDGQQRLTTLLLILIYFKLCPFNEVKDDDFIHEIKRINLSSECEKDNQIIQMIIKSKSLDELFKTLNNEQKLAKEHSDLFYHQQIKIYKSALNTIKKFFENGNVKKDWFEKIYHYIFNNVKVIHIVSKPDDLIGDQFFTSLNGKGLKLDQVDLLKSSFIHPYMTTKDGIKCFKNKWASLIKNTKNDMQNEISNYFVSYTKEITKITPSKLNDQITKKWQNDEDIKIKFEEMCDFFSKYASLLNANTKNPKINFYIKLNQKFNFDNYKKVIFTTIMNTHNLSMDNTSDLNVIANILESLFKINFIYLTILCCTANTFIGDVINEYVKSNQKMNANEICKSLVCQLKKILNYTDINIGERFKNYKFNYDSLHYDSVKTNIYKIIFLLNLVSETFNPDIKDIDYNKAIGMITNHIDHRVPKAEKNVSFYDENNKKVIPWKIERKDHKKIIKFSDSFFDVFQDKNFISKYHIEKDMPFDKFVNILNQPFNLKLLDENTNKHKNASCRLQKDELIRHFTIQNESNVKNKLTKSWNWFIYNKEYKTMIESNHYTYTIVWKMIEQSLKNKLLDNGISTIDMESMRKKPGFLKSLIKLAYEKGIIKDRDDLNLCMHILANRNNAIHNGASDELKPDYKNLILKLLDKIG